MSGQVPGEEAPLLSAPAVRLPEFKEEENERPEEGEKFPGADDVTLPWPGDREKKREDADPEGEAGGSTQSEWRRSAPEADGWKDDGGGEGDDEDDGGALADDEKEIQDESLWVPEKGAAVVTPRVKILRRASSAPQESRLDVEVDVDRDDFKETLPFDPELNESKEKIYWSDVCSDKLKLALWTAAAALIFPFLVWGGYALLPFDSPLIGGAPHRVVYALRCAVFASVPIMLGVVVQGVARVRYGEVKARFQNPTPNRKVSVHEHYVSQSAELFFLYFLQLAVLASYLNHDHVKIVPLLTIVFVFGRLIYWLCLSLGSCIRGLGFGLSFFPILVMLVANVYLICSSTGPESVFDVEPPVAASPPKQRSWG
ncbi:transmembrane protein 79 [Stigmatopora argus]